MGQAQAAILGTFVGGLAAILAAYFTAAMQAKSAQKNGCENNLYQHTC